MSDAQDHRFSLVGGGPFNAALGRIGLLGPDQLPTPRAAFGIAFCAWLLPGLLAVAQALGDAGHDAAAYFLDPTTLARFLLATGILLASERRADARLGEMIQQFWEARLLGPGARAPFFERLRRADRLSSSALAEALILLAALAGAHYNVQFVIGLQHGGWEGALVGNAVVTSWAGLAARWFSIPLFMFLVLRALWRLLVWSALLWRISRLPLALVPLHGDRCAGLGFLSLFPGAFQGVVFAMSCVVAAMMFRHLQPGGGVRGMQELVFACAAWFGFNLVVFVGPLFVFTAPLLALREAELTSHGRTVNKWYRRFHAQWIAEDAVGARGHGDAADADMPDLEDITVAIEALRNLRPLPMDRVALLQLLAAAGAPLLVAAATKVPLLKLLGGVAGVML